MSTRDPSSLSSLPMQKFSLSQIASIDPVSLLALDLDGKEDGWGDDINDTDASDRQIFQGTGGNGWRRPSQMREKSIGLFGSLLTTSAPYYVTGSTSLSKSLSSNYVLEKQKQSLHFDPNNSGIDEEKENDVASSLLSSLSLMRDRYLTASLNKMNEPVLQVLSIFQT